MPSGFNARDFERSLKKQVNDAAMAQLRELKSSLERLSTTHRDKPLPEIKTAIKAVFDVSDPQLTEMAEHIQAGDEVDYELPRKVL